MGMSPPAAMVVGGGGGGAAAPATAMAMAMAAVPEGYAREAILAWYRGEFAAANAIIDALCGHIAEIADGSPEYETVFAAIHRRRMNWIPVLHMQKYYSIADVAAELRRATARKRAEAAGRGSVAVAEVVHAAGESPEEEVRAGSAGGIAREEGIDGVAAGDSKILDDSGGSDGGSQGGKASPEGNQICADHQVCIARPERIKISKGFVSKELVKGHMVNVVKGLKVFEDIFTDSEILRVSEFINELRLSGRRGELSGETFIFFNKEMKGNKREIIQLGVPLFQQAKEEATSNIEPIPELLQTVIDHLAEWRLIPESRKPNSCIINFFDEDEYSQPYFKPPHLDNPISTLLLSDATLAFGRVLVSDHQGFYKGSFTLPVKEGSLLVMRGNSADMARHVICPSSNRRVSITFVKVRPPNNTDAAVIPSMSKAMTLWQPGNTIQHKLPAASLSYGTPGIMSSMGMALRAGPIIMFAPPKPMFMSPSRRVSRSNGTGVFLPWTVGPKKYIRHLPPRIQKRRLPPLPSSIENQVDKIPQIPAVMV